MGIPAVDAIKELSELGMVEKRIDGRYYSLKRSCALPESIIKKHIGEIIRFSSYGSDYVEKRCL
jgi:hypothetical protein